MTTVITRYFESADQARQVQNELIYNKRVPESAIDLFDETGGLKGKLADQQVTPDTAEAYASRMAGGGAVLLVRASFKPLGVARIVRQTTAAMGAVDLGNLQEEVVVKTERGDPNISVLQDHPLFLTRWLTRRRENHHMADWPIPLISRRKPSDAFAFPRHARMANLFLPLLSKRKPSDNFAFPRHARMASFPIGLLVPGQKYMAKFPFAHIVPGHKYMAKFPFAHIVPGHKFMAKFPFGHLVPQAYRKMANWPFPLLINDKTGTNALVPGHKRMANFPIGLLVPGQKYQAKFPFAHIVPGHKHMANFPIALISRRKPADKFAFPRHARMADTILPLISRREPDSGNGQSGFSLSRMLGLRTVIRR